MARLLLPCFDELMRVTFGSLPPDGKTRNVILEQILEANGDRANILKITPDARNINEHLFTADNSGRSRQRL